MKATKLTLVAAGLFAVLAVPATASDVSIYGRAHLSLDSLDNGVDSGTNVSSNSSRLGFKANKKLDGGIEAFMQIEQNVRFDEGAGNWGSRDSFVGIKADFGQVRIGQFDTPLKAVRGKVDMFGDRMGDVRNLTRVQTTTTGATSVSTANIGNVFDERYKNGVHYQSPSMNNFTFDLHYTPHNDNNATVSNVRESTSMALTYDVKGFYAAIAYETFEGLNNLDPTALRAGVYYDLTSALRLAGLYQSASDIPGGDRNVYGLGASYKMGDYVLRGQYYVADDNDAKDSGASMLVIGADRNFGKDLVLYAAYGITSNDDAARFGVSGGGRDTSLAAVQGKDASGLSLGMMYNF